MKRGSLNFYFFFLLVGFLFSLPAFSEPQNFMSLTVPATSAGESGAFNTSQITGAAATGTGTYKQSYAGVSQFDFSSGTGRYGSLGALTRYGVSFDSFVIFQSFLTANYLTVGSTNTDCPSATTYNWLLTRYR